MVTFLLTFRHLAISQLIINELQQQQQEEQRKEILSRNTPRKLFTRVFRGFFPSLIFCYVLAKIYLGYLLLQNMKTIQLKNPIISTLFPPSSPRIEYRAFLKLNFAEKSKYATFWRLLHPKDGLFSRDPPFTLCQNNTNENE